MRNDETQLRKIIQQELNKTDNDERIERAVAPLDQPATNYGSLMFDAVRNQMRSSSQPDQGISAARIFRSLAAARGNIADAKLFADNEYGARNTVSEAFSKALAAGEATAGGFLLQEEMAREVIDLLRPRSVVRAIGPQIVRPRRGALDFPKITSGATAAYVGENEDIAVSQPVFGQINLSAKKLAAWAKCVADPWLART